MKSTLRTEPHQIRLPVPLWRALEREATRDGKSRAELIRGILVEFIKWREDRRDKQ